MKIYTIGFTKTTAQHFFERLNLAGVKSVIDVRLKADSQLSGFAKKQDLTYFVPMLASAGYTHNLCLAPTKEMLDLYKKKHMTWAAYESAYIDLLEARQVEKTIDPADVDGSCFLCSESAAHNCHRRLAAEYLAAKWNDRVVIKHL